MIKCQGDNERRLKCVLLKVSSTLKLMLSGDMLDFHLILSVVLFRPAVKAMRCASQRGIHEYPLDGF